MAEVAHSFRRLLQCQASGSLSCGDSIDENEMLLAVVLVVWAKSHSVLLPLCGILDGDNMSSCREDHDINRLTLDDRSRLQRIAGGENMIFLRQQTDQKLQ